MKNIYFTPKTIEKKSELIVIFKKENEAYFRTIIFMTITHIVTIFFNINITNNTTMYIFFTI